MSRSILLLFVLALCATASGQNNIEKWDKALDDSTKGKLKKIKTGRLAHGFAVFYFKSDKSIFSAQERLVCKTNGREDSASGFIACFRNDTLFRVYIRKNVRGGIRGVAIMYLDGYKILEQSIEGQLAIPEISSIKETAYRLLAKAKELVKKE